MHLSPALLEQGAPLRFGHPTHPTARVLHQIRTLPHATRVLLRDTLGLSAPSVTRHVRSLIDAGLVEESAPQGSDDRVGRPQTSLDIDARHVVIWGAHVGARSTTVLAADGAGRVIREADVDMAVSGHAPEQTIARLAQGMAAV
ncbi:MarR family transcriptional regulator, partial [Corynebacterium nasicanis]